LSNRALVNVGDEEDDDDARCYVVGKPELTTMPHDVDVSFGDTAYFSCRANGDPRPEIVWYRNR